MLCGMKRGHRGWGLRCYRSSYLQHHSIDYACPSVLWEVKTFIFGKECVESEAAGLFPSIKRLLLKLIGKLRNLATRESADAFIKQCAAAEYNLYSAAGAFSLRIFSYH